ncbi:TPA: DUF4238 domain-containing protein [Bacillus thuringiensis]|nr:DUF4238 domain-containing protein [Bacillus thuringiensis]
MVKRQHYVPRFYLKYFAVNDRVNYYDKILSRKFSNTHVDNVAHQRYFYDLSEEFLSKQQENANKSMDSRFFDKQFIEGFFSKLEDGFAKSFRTINEKLYNSPNIFETNLIDILGEEEKIDLVFFIALQSIRTPAFRELSGNFINMLQVNIPDFTDILPDDNERLLFHLASGVLDRVGRYLLSDKFEWYLAVIEKTETAKSQNWRTALMKQVNIYDEFLISDNPVVNIKHIEKNTLNISTEFCLPLSQKHLLVIRERNYPFENPDNSIFIPSNNMIRFYNEYQIRFAARKIIYNNSTNEKKLNKYFKLYPRDHTHNTGTFCVHEWEGKVKI